MLNASTIRCLITAGPTREYIDPARYISSPSTGKMGFALAKAAVEQGWTVDLVAGPVALSEPEGSILYPVTSAEEMYHSLERLQQLPDETLIYCAHEYTLSNGNFALTIDPDNEDLHERMDQIKGWLAKGGYTIPTQMKVEKLTNPFLRTYDTSIRQNLNMEQATNVQVFAEIRHRKDRFKG